MSPVIKEINELSYKPFKENKITQEEALDNGIKPLKVFMLKQVYEEDLDLFLSLSDSVDQTDMAEFNSQEKLLDLSLTIIVPAFITSELKEHFLLDFALYTIFDNRYCCIKYIDVNGYGNATTINDFITIQAYVIHIG